jgi:tetratricopeptide (TPR) repeat protein
MNYQPLSCKTIFARLWTGASVGSIAMALLAASPSYAEETLAVKTLKEQARYWESKGRPELAASAWKRLLQIDPRNAEALGELAQLELDSNRPDAVRAITDELKKQPEANRDVIRRIENAAAEKKAVDPKLLEQARAASRAGELDDAIKLYRRLLEGRTIKGPIALELYQTLGGTSDGWDEARKGLQGLRADDPGNHAVALAYAQHLTYRADTRREGIRMLADLARKPQVGATALVAWRRALSWMELSRNDTALLKEYLEVQPNDAAIRSLIAGLNQVTPATPPKPLDARSLALRDGFTALTGGDVDAAEKRFESLLRSGPKNPDALGGLGVVRLKQERVDEAAQLLSEAVKVSGNRNWQGALNSARYFIAMRDGASAVANGDLAGARKLYERAAEIDRQNVLTTVALADLLVQEGRLLDAEQAYRAALVAHPKSVDVLRGLTGVLSRQGKVEEALALAEKLSEEDKIALGYGKLRAEQFRGKALAALERNDPADAMAQFEEALLWDPNNPWLRLELARVYHKFGAPNEAFGLMDGLLQSYPDMPDVLYAAALMSAQAKEFTLALALLEKIPVGSRTREMAESQRKMWVRAQVGKADVLAKMGQTAQAMNILDQALVASGRDADSLAAIAQVMLDLGDEARSLTMMRTLLAQTPKPDTDLLIQYAGLLLTTRQDVELAAQLRQLYGQTLTPAQRTGVDGIRWVYSVRQTDVQREAGNFSAAYEIAAQLLSEKPNDVSAQLALARLYSSAGEHDRALAWYHQVLQMNPQADVATLVAAGGTALQAGELAYAEAALARAELMAPSNPEVLSTKGRLARVQGKNKLAVELLQQAQQVSLAQSQIAKSGPLGVNIVDYSMPVAVPAGRGGTSPGSIPPIPNPLGARSLGPSGASNVRPLMQPVAPQAVPGVYGRPISISPQNSESTAITFVPKSAAGSVEKRAEAVSSSVYSDLPPARDGMKPVQYVSPQFPRFPADSNLAPSVQQAQDQAVPWQRPPVGQTSVFAQPVAVQGPPMLTPVNSFPAATYSSSGQSNGSVNQGYGFQTEANRQAPTPYMSPLQMAPVQSAQFDATSPGGAGVSGRSNWDIPPAPQFQGRLSAVGGLQREIDELRADRASVFGAGAMWRGRNGDAGTSELSDFSTVIEGRFAFGQGSRLVLRLEPVFLSAGRISSTDLNASQLFGSNALAIIAGGVGTTREQQDAGVALSLGYESARLKLDLGTTPLGFQVANVVGGVSYSDSFGDVRLKLDVSRRPITDSLLSYAGTVDDVTGRTWGGVTATGGRVEFGVEQGRFGLLGYGAAHVLTGKNVVSNNRFEIGAGAYYKFVQDADMVFTAGVSAAAMSYKRNLRYFTLGHGGYFSPQRHFSLSLPLELSGRYGRLSYKLDGAVSLQNSRENSAAIFPGDPVQQANLETAAAASAVAAPTGVTYRAFYPSQSSSGLGFRLGAAGEYQFAPQWMLGGSLAVDKASSYMQTSGLIYVKYSFDPIYAATKIPVNPMKVGQ